MGNKAAATDLPTKQTQKPDHVDERSEPLTLVPTSLKFSKVDIVEYGKVFDQYEHTRNDGDVAYAVGELATLRELHQISDDDEKWYLDENLQRQVEQKCRGYQFRLRDVLFYCVTFNQYELLEFVLNQELFETNYWHRDYFKCALAWIILRCSQLMKLNALQIVASYMVPERIALVDFQRLIQDSRRFEGMYSSEAEKRRFEDLCNGTLEQGMNDRAVRIVETRKVLLTAINEYLTFPAELAPVIMAYMFGMRS